MLQNKNINIRHKKFSTSLQSKIVTAIAIVVTLIISIRAINISLLETSEEDNLARLETRFIREEKILTPRRSITDRNGTLLTSNIELYSIYINPQKFTDQDLLIFQRSLLWDDEYTQNKSTIWIRYKNLNNIYYPFARDLFESKVRSLEDDYTNFIKKTLLQNQENQTNANTDPCINERILDIHNPNISRFFSCKQISIEPSYKRIYSMAEETGSLIGITSSEGEGVSGLEEKYNDFLDSDSFLSLREIDARNNLVAIKINDQENLIEEETNDINTLPTTIDSRIQNAAYYHLKKHLDNIGINYGLVMIVSVKTGEILANVSYPSFNPNNRSELNIRTIYNSGFIDSFEPGSTIKPLVLAKLFENSNIHPDDIIDINYGRWKAGSGNNTFIRDISTRFKTISVNSVLAHSSNVAISKLVDKNLDKITDLTKYYQQIGFGVKTEVNFPRESEGTISNSLRRIDILRNSFGYGFTVTAAQLLSAYQALANNGIRVTLSQIAIDDKQKVRNAIFTEDASKKTLYAMENVVDGENGTAKLARIPGYAIAGKTGTARVWTIDEYGVGRYDETKHRVLFAGIVPADDPDMVAIVVVDSPDVENPSGGKTAAPIFKDIMQEALLIRGIFPNTSL